MSLMKSSININPLYATNSIDNGHAGLYQIQPNNSNLAMRLGTSNLGGITGEIFLNTSNIVPIFQGYNGINWVDFNASVGPQGPSGQDFTNIVNFNNLTANNAPSSVVTLGEIFASTLVDVSSNISNVNIRSLQSGTYDINSNLNVQTMVLTQNSNIISLINQPLPYTWDIASNNSISYLKNSSSENNFFSWGETSRWIVKQGITINKGQAVRLTNDTITNNIVITPVTYTSLIGIDPFNTPFNMLGIATQTATSGQSCNVCIKGITTVLCTNDVNVSEFIRSDSVPYVGLDGLVGKDGGIFYNTTPSPTVTYIRAGYFLESGPTIASNNNYSLFYVEPQINIF